MNFKVEIKLGNDAMQTVSAIAVFLMEVVSKVQRWQPEDDLPGGAIMDENGNRVGFWEITSD